MILYSVLICTLFVVVRAQQRDEVQPNEVKIPPGEHRAGKPQGNDQQALGTALHNQWEASDDDGRGKSGSTLIKIILNGFM